MRVTLIVLTTLALLALSAMAAVNSESGYVSFPRYQRQLSHKRNAEDESTADHQEPVLKLKKKKEALPLPPSGLIPPTYKVVDAENQEASTDTSTEASSDSDYVMDLERIHIEAAVLCDKLLSDIRLIRANAWDILQLHRITRTKARKSKEIIQLQERLEDLQKKHKGLLEK